MSSRVIGLSGILPFVCLPHLPEIPVVRPLLTLRKVLNLFNKKKVTNYCSFNTLMLGSFEESVLKQ